jgi:HEAT repeat protein
VLHILDEIGYQNKNHIFQPFLKGENLVFICAKFSIHIFCSGAHTNGNLLHLDNIANLEWCYNNTLNKLTKADKPNTTQYYVYDYQGN